MNGGVIRKGMKGWGGGGVVGGGGGVTLEGRVVGDGGDYKRDSSVKQVVWL